MNYNAGTKAPAVTGKRITVRPLELSDYERFVLGYRSCLPSRNPFDEGCFDTSFMTRVWYEELLERRRREAGTDYSYMFHVFCNEDERALGYCDITVHMRENFQYARIGYTIFNNYWGQGYATECVECLTTLGFDFLNLHRLEAHVNPNNPASKRVLEKAGFAFECVRRGVVLEDGKWLDNEIYYRNNERWREEK